MWLITFIMTNKDTIFFYFSLPLFVLNSISFFATAVDIISIRSFYNFYFLVSSGVLQIVYIFYYVMRARKKKSYNKIIVIFMILYTLAFLLVSDIKYIVNYILFILTLIQIVFSFERKKAVTVVTSFISTYCMLYTGKAVGFGKSLVEVVEKDTSKEVFLIVSIILISLLMTIVYMINHHFSKYEQRLQEEAREKKFKEACFKKEITKSEEPVLRLMLEGKGREEIMRITGFKLSNTKKKIASIKSKLELRMYFTNQKEEVRRALFDE